MTEAALAYRNELRDKAREQHALIRETNKKLERNHAERLRLQNKKKELCRELNRINDWIRSLGN